MHAEQTSRLRPIDADRNVVGALAHIVAGFRWRLGFESLARFAARGLIVSSAFVIGVSLVTWLLSVPVPTWIVASPFMVAVGIGLLRWPSVRQAALAADSRLALDERLATAVELVRRPAPGRFDLLQVHDAVAEAQAASSGFFAFQRGLRRDSLAALAAISLAAASLFLPSLPRPSAPGAADANTSDVSVVADPAQAGATDVPDLAAVPVAPSVPQPQTDADLAARVQQEQAERGALDKLSQALGTVSAGQPAADAIQQGDFASAANQVASLGDQADQLSDAAKRQLSQALQNASTATSTADRQLADKERQAAQALSRPGYNDQQQALRSLADQLQRSGDRSVPADQLARDLGQLQQQNAGPLQPQTGAQSGQSAPAQQPAGANGPLSGNSSQGAPSAFQQPGLPSSGGREGGANGGQQGGAGVGTGTNSDVESQASTLDSSGQTVQVPTKLGNGPGVRPQDGTEDQTGTDGAMSTRSVNDVAVQAQQTGQVAPEQNLVPGEQRPVVRGYFR